ncbi:type II toxin-antitoxin system RelE/ParE family toxin, partial [Escherichia coli]|uniref:type II toxin-antitoxin system RelE/ParE family toxin n=3 Tax=Escherichia coli TaxID=562 RepID=UPI00201AFAEF
MGVYKARRFSQSTKKLGIHDKVLMAAAEEVMQGIWEADLGSGVIKKRLPLQQGCLLYTSPRIRGFVISAKLLSVVACG